MLSHLSTGWCRRENPNSLKGILFLCLWGAFIYKDSDFSRLSCKSQAGKKGVLLGSGHCPAGSLGGDFLSSLLGWFQLAMSLLAHVLYTCSLAWGTTWGGGIKLLEGLGPGPSSSYC